MLDPHDRIVFFDLETGGLDPAVHPVIQFAAVAVDGRLQEVDAMEVKVVFDVAKANPEALAQNHYSPEVWAVHAVQPAGAKAQIAAFLRRHATLEKISAKGKPYTVARMAGHNSRFDAEFIAPWFKASGEFLPGACFEALCTLNLARWASLGADPGPKDHKLGSLCEWLGIPLGESAHDALADVRATVEVARVLCSRLGLLGGTP